MFRLPTGERVSRDRFSVAVEPLSSVSDARARRWRELADRAIEPNSDLDPRFLLPAGRIDPRASDILVAFVERGDTLLGAFAFSVRKAGRRVRVGTVTTAGDFMRQNAERHYPLVGPEDPVGTLRALFRALRRGRYPRLLDLRHLPADGVLADALAQALREEGMATLERSRHEEGFVHSAPNDAIPTDEVFDFSQASSKRRREYGRQVRALERETGATLRVVDRAAEPEVIDHFLRFQAEGWKGDSDRGGDAMTLNPVRERWYREVVAGFQRDGALNVPTLMAGDEVIYMDVCLRSGGRLFGSLDAYNDRYANCAPGLLGRLACWRYVRDVLRVPTYDPKTSWHYVTSTKLYPDRRAFVELLVANRGPVSWVAVMALRAAIRGRSLVGRNAGPVEESA